MSGTSPTPLQITANNVGLGGVLGFWCALCCFFGLAGVFCLCVVFLFICLIRIHKVTV